jgi:hypothetical protein
MRKNTFSNSASTVAWLHCGTAEVTWPLLTVARSKRLQLLLTKGERVYLGTAYQCSRLGNTAFFYCCIITVFTEALPMNSEQIHYSTLGEILVLQKVKLFPLLTAFSLQKFRNVKKYGNPVFRKGIIWREVRWYFVLWATMYCTLGQSVGGTHTWSGQKVFHWQKWKFRTLSDIIIDPLFSVHKETNCNFKKLNALILDSLLRVCQL